MRREEGGGVGADGGGRTVVDAGSRQRVHLGVSTVVKNKAVFVLRRTVGLGKVWPDTRSYCIQLPGVDVAESSRLPVCTAPSSVCSRYNML